MRRYRYKAFRPDGAAVTGALPAASASDAARTLRERGCTVARLRPERRLLPRWISGRALALFCREWASLLSAGLPMTEALAILARHGRRAARQTFADIAATVASGQTAAAAFRQSGAFPPFFLAMVAVGEQSGTLPEQLRRLGAYYEKSARLRRQFFAALAYPAFVLCLASALFLLVLTVILPSFSLLFESLDLPLPAVTARALALGLFLRQDGPVLLAGCGLALLALLLWKRTRRGRAAWDRLLFRSRFLRRLFLIRFCASLAALLRSGAPLSDALHLTEAAAGNGEGKRRIRLAEAALASGCGFAESLAASGLSSPALDPMAAAGEAGGELPEFLGEAARLMAEETGRVLDRWKALLEPALLLFVGGLTAAVVFTVMIPLFTAAGRALP